MRSQKSHWGLLRKTIEQNQLGQESFFDPKGKFHVQMATKTSETTKNLKILRIYIYRKIFLRHWTSDSPGQ